MPERTLQRQAGDDRRALLQALADVRALREAVRLGRLLAAEELFAECVRRLKAAVGETP